MLFEETKIEIPEALRGKRILITGGAGVIGSRLAHVLSQSSTVVVIDDLTSGYIHNVPENSEFVQGSVTETKPLRKAFELSPQIVFHLAANFANQNSVDNPERDLHVNGHGTIRVLQEALQCGVEKFIYASSSCVYGRRPGQLEENQHTLQLDTPYAITKKLGEYYVNFFAHHDGLNASSVRYFNIYGPRELPGQYRNVIPNFFYKAMQNQTLKITGTGNETRDFTYLDDAINGTLLAAAKAKPCEVYNLGKGEETTINELAEKINLLAGSSTPIEYFPRRDWDCIDHRRASNEKAKEQLDYVPRTELSEGLTQTYKWFEANWDQIAGMSYFSSKK
jgi:UDP-glucose 4-epimerase